MSQKTNIFPSTPANLVIWQKFRGSDTTLSQKSSRCSGYNTDAHLQNSYLAVEERQIIVPLYEPMAKFVAGCLKILTFPKEVNQGLILRFRSSIPSCRYFPMTLTTFPFRSALVCITSRDLFADSRPALALS